MFGTKLGRSWYEVGTKLVQSWYEVGTQLDKSGTKLVRSQFGTKLVPESVSTWFGFKAQIEKV